MNRLYLLITLLCLSVSQLLAQSEPPERCSFDDVLKRQMRNDPQVQQRMQAAEEQIQRNIMRQWKSGQAKLANTVYTIPVVFHVIHNGGAIGAADNPSDATLQDALAGLNEYFRKQKSTFSGADIEIQFALATRGPDCLTTTGINRVYGGNVPAFSSKGMIFDADDADYNEVAIKDLSRWSNNDYINIWVVPGLKDAVGFAYFPGANARIDGVVMLASYTIREYRTLAHEMGHFFSLYHTFEGDNDGDSCPSETDCGTQNDRVCDTERHSRLAGDFCSTGSSLTNICTGAPFQIVDANFNYTVLNNYMAYVPLQACRNMFTEGQKARIRAALDGPRASLKNGYGFITTPLTNLSSGISPARYLWRDSNNIYSSCAGETTLQANTRAYATYQWQKDGLDVTGATSSTFSPTVSGAYRLVQTVCGQQSTTSTAISVLVYAAPSSVSISVPGTRICTGSTLILTAVTDEFSYANKHQWYKDSQPIAGATASSYTATQAGTYYVVTSRCSTTLTSASVDITSGPGPTTACTPTFSNTISFAYGLTNLTLPGINASSGTTGFDNGRYIDRTCAYFGQVVSGSVVSFSVRTFNSSYVKLFLDKANNGTFVELASTRTTSTTVPATGTFTVPLDALTNTALRLRVGVSPRSATAIGPCGLNEELNSSGSGQIEDFSLIILNDPSNPCSGVIVNANLLGSGTLSCTTPTLTLTATGGTSYTFSNTGGTLGTPGSASTLEVSAPGTYSVKVADANGCTAIQSTTISGNTASPTLSLGVSNSLDCGQTSAVLSATATGFGSLTYTFRGGGLPGSPSTNSTVTVNQGGSYSVLVTAANGCTASQSASVISSTTLPTASLVASGSLNCTQTSVTLTASGGVSYTFANASGTIGTPGSASTLAVNQGGVYSVTVANAANCTSSTTITVLSNTATPTASLTAISQRFCAGTSLSLTASGGVSYTFSPGATQTGGNSVNTATVTQSGVYTVTVSTAHGCTNTATLSVTATPTTGLVNEPLASLSVCAGGVVMVPISASGTPPLTYQWYRDGSLVSGQTSATLSLPTAQTTDSGNYSVEVTGACGSATSTAFSLTVNPIPSVAISANPSLTISSLQTVVLTASGANTYKWSNLESTTAITTSFGGPYSVTGTSNGCSSTASVTVLSLTETAGITVGASGLPNDVNGGTIQAGDLIVFTFVLTNTGNDPTRFRIPNQASTTGPGLVSGVLPADQNGTTPASGQLQYSTDSGITWTNVTPGGNDTPSIPVNGTVRVRVPLTVQAGVQPNDVISLQLGNTPANAQNQARTPDGGDVYTVDNPDGTVTGELIGAPTNGVREASFTQSITVIILLAPTITSQPATASSVCEGASVMVTVGVSNSVTSYQWLKGSSPVPGQTTATLSLGNVQMADAGVYSLSITGPGGSTTSNGFTLTVNPLPAVTLLVPNSVTVQGAGAGIATLTVPPNALPLSFQALGGVLYERLIVLDRINSFEIRQVDSNNTGVFPITRLGLFTLTVTGASGCKRTVQWVVQVQ